jgi:hypothetical protein
MGTLDDAMEVLISEMGDGMQLLNIIEELVPDMDSADPFPAAVLVAIVMALFICLIIRWGGSAKP